MTSSQEIETIKAIVFMTALFIFLIVILAIVLFVTSRRNKSRGDSLRGLAQKNGWKFFPDPSKQEFARIYEIDRRATEITNMIIADIDGCRVMPATAINTTIQATTTIAFRPISPFGTPKIAIPGDPRFSSRYTVRGHDTNAVRRIFTPQVLAAMGNYPLFL